MFLVKNINNFSYIKNIEITQFYFLIMQLSETHNEYIKKQFRQIATKEDLLQLINYAKEVLFPNVKEPKPIQIKSLNYYANHKIAKRRYTQFIIRKKNGGERIINSPVSQLKLIQKCINLIFNVIFNPTPYAMGFVPGKSIVDNAKIHVGKNYVFNIDLADFFPSIDFRRIKSVLQLEPFNLNDQIAFLVANLCCNNGGLPQGAPTSPTLTNVVCQKLDKKLNGLAKKNSCSYSRYADDITFSSSHNVYQPEGDLQKELRKIIKGQNFIINKSKTRLQKHAYRQEVTGIIVNEKINLNRRYIRQLRAMLYNLESLGLKGAYSKFINKYLVDKGHVKRGTPDFINVLSGKLEYMKMVRGVSDLLYKKYNDKFQSLVEIIANDSKINTNLNQVLDIWEENGIEQAIKAFKIKNNERDS